MHRKSIIRKTVQVGSSTLLSRMLGLTREILMANYLGVGILAEAFITAYKIPNSLRKIFAEGALSVSFIPTFVALIKKNKTKEEVNRLMSLSLFFFEGILLLLCLICIWKAEFIIKITAPGWFTANDQTIPFCANIRSHFADSVFAPYIDNFISSIEFMFNVLQANCGSSPQVQHAITFLRILMSFILLLSTSALLAGALQAIHHFFVPAFSPVLLNIFFIGGLIICFKGQLSPIYLCWFIMLGGLVQLLLHFFTYFKFGFSLQLPNKNSWKQFSSVVLKFLPCLLSMSILEMYLFVDTSLGSFLPTGSIALIYYANRFMQIPLGVVATALSTILLPYFTQIGMQAPKRLGFYLLESTKLITWIMVPIAFLIGFSSYQIFSTLFLSEKFTIEHAQEASIILIAALYGVVFFSLNKILLNVYYGLHSTVIPMFISIIAVVSNGLISYYLMLKWGAYGIALGTSIAGLIQTILSLILLSYRFSFPLYLNAFTGFLIRFCIQLALIVPCFLGSYIILYNIIKMSFRSYSALFLTKIGFWAWYIPLACAMVWLLFKTRKLFKIKIYFLE